MAPLLLYIHGFLSSPGSFKARQTAAYLQENHPHIELKVPQVPVQPRQAIALLESLVALRSERPVGLIGSSLGGYYALNLAVRFDLPAVLVNPAVSAHLDLAKHQGEHVHPYTGEQFEVGEEQLAALAELHVQPQANEYQKILLLVQTGDETLDYQKACAQLSKARRIIEYGGDHSFTHFERWLPEIIRFLRL